MLFRILHGDFIRVENGAIKMRSHAFLDGRFETSCFLDGPNVWTLMVQFFQGLYVARVTAEKVRAIGYMVAFAIEPEDCSIEELRKYHVVLFPPAGITNSQNKRLCEQIRNSAELVGPLILESNL